MENMIPHVPSPIFLFPSKHEARKNKIKVGLKVMMGHWKRLHPDWLDVFATKNIELTEALNRQ